MADINLEGQANKDKMQHINIVILIVKGTDLTSDSATVIKYVTRSWKGRFSVNEQ